MAVIKKNHSTDYLNEYKAKKEIPNWLRLLIQKAIDTKGVLNEEDKVEIFEKLLEENKCNFYEKTFTDIEEAKIEAAKKSE